MRKILLLTLAVIFVSGICTALANQTAPNAVTVSNVNPIDNRNDSKSAPPSTPLPANDNFALTTFINEGFEGTTFPPTGWTRVITNASYTWQRSTNYAHSGAAGANVPWNYSQDEWLISPTFSLAGAGASARVKFWWMTSYYWMVNPYPNGDYELWISTDGGTSWSAMLWDENSEGVFSSWTWYQESISLAAYIGQTNLKLGFHYIADDAADVGLDDVVVTDDPDVPCVVTCPPGATLETEACGDSTNGGCNRIPFQFQSVTCPDTVCGTAWATTSLRDTDWYLLTLTQAESLYYYGTAEFPLLLILINAGTGNCTTYSVVASASGNPCDTVSIIRYLAAGTYYLWAGPSVWVNMPCDGSGDYTNDYTIWFDCRGHVVGPPNDDCVNVTPVPLAPGSPLTFTGDNSNATNDCALLTYPQVWHAFTTTECLDITVDYCTTTPAFGNAHLVLVSGCPCASTVTYSSYDLTTCGDGNVTIRFLGVPAGTYYYPVLNDPANNAVGPYTIHISGVACPPPPANDDCANAQPVGFVFQLPWSTTSATNDGGGTCMTSKNIWYLFTSPVTDTVHVALCGSSFDTKLAVYDGSTCSPLPTQLFCNDDACGGTLQSEGYFYALQNNQYLIEVGGYASYSGNGLLTIEAGDPIFGVTPTSLTDTAAVGSSVTDTLTVTNTGPAALNFTVVGTQNPFLRLDVDRQFESLRIPEGASIAAENKDVKHPFLNNPTVKTEETDEAYLAMKQAMAEQAKLEAQLALKGASQAMAESKPDPAVILQGGDDIANATVISSLPYSDAGTTTGYTNDYNGSCGSYGNAAPDVVYSYTPSSNQSINISLCGSSFDTRLYVFENSSSTEIACNDDYCGLQSQLDGVSLTSGNTYYIVIDGYNTANGSYTINVTPYAPPTCTPDITVNLPAALPYNDLDRTNCGLLNDFSNTCLGSYDGGEDIIYELNVTSTICVDVTLTPDSTWTGIVLDDECPPNPTSCIATSTSYSAAPHGFSGITLTPGLYYIMVDTWPTPNCATFDLSIIACPPAPPNDDCANATAIAGPYPANVSGTTLGATLDCPGILDWNGVWYTFNAPYASNTVYIDYCPTTTSLPSVGAVFFTDCTCDTTTWQVYDAGSFVTCPNTTTNAQIFWYNVPGPATYYLPVTTGTVGANFEFVIDVTQYIPCVVNCPPGATPEPESCSLDLNGGCNSTPPVFSDIACGDTICGTAWANTSLRDTDWYILRLANPSLITYTGVAEFPFLMFVINAGDTTVCGDESIVSSATADPCSTATISASLAAGVWYLWAGPSSWFNMPCDGSGDYTNDYVISLSCQPLWLIVGTSGGSVPPFSSFPVPVTMSAANLTAGTYTGNVIFSTNDPLTPTANVPVTFVVTAGGACDYVLGDINGDGNRIGGDVTFGVRYFKGIGSAPPDSCYMDSTGTYLYVAGDVNGNCEFRGSDITRLVAFFKGNAALAYCHFFPPPIIRPLSPLEVAPIR